MTMRKDRRNRICAPHSLEQAACERRVAHPPLALSPRLPVFAASVLLKACSESERSRDLGCTRAGGRRLSRRCSRTIVVRSPEQIDANVLAPTCARLPLVRQRRDPSLLGRNRRGKDGKVRRSLGFACVRSPARKPLQTGGLSERARTGATGRSHLPCRRSWVRVPSSASKTPVNGGFSL